LSEYGLRNEAVDLFINERALADFFEKAVVSVKDAKELVVLAANYITSDIVSLIKKGGVENTDELNEISEKTIRVSPESYLALMEMIVRGELSSRGAKDVLAKMYELGGGLNQSSGLVGRTDLDKSVLGDPRRIAEDLGVVQKSDMGELKKLVEEVLAENPERVAEYKAGKVAVLQFLMGQAMKKSRGSGNPKVLTEILQEMLK
jgi:aspartyl-tRNA(Asn)/glutamyl-tRNA(Gln) amidotransferase subunit B